MHEHICKELMNNGARLVYTASPAMSTSLLELIQENHSFHYEVSINEKVAFELALTGAVASKKTACIFTTDGFYRALDPIMTSAYTGVIGGFLIVCIRETEEEVTPIGPFSKLPVIVAESPEALTRAIVFGYEASARHQIPFIIQTSPEKDGRVATFEVKEPLSGSPSMPAPLPSQFTKDPGRWAALPKSRYRLHKELNLKLEEIREEFETYEGNRTTLQGTTGVIRDRSSSFISNGEDGSIFDVETVFPLPLISVNSFIEKMDKVFISEGKYPAMELQIGDRDKIESREIGAEGESEEADEMMYGFHVTRDILGPASAINMAHGMTKLDPDKKVLAITNEDHFFHSGMPAFVNTIYNGSSYVLLIMTNTKEDEIKRIIEGWGFGNCFHIGHVAEIEPFRDTGRLTVLLCKGTI